MKKLLPILAISICALLLLSLGRPVTANPSFPADGDTFEYDVAFSMNGVNTTGPNISEAYTYGYNIEFINHTGDYYFANHTIDIPSGDEYGPLNGTTIGYPLCHYNPASGSPLLFYPWSYSNWSMGIDNDWTSDYFFIEGGTQPGDELTFGSGQSGTASHYEYPYPNPYSSWYTQFTLPVGPGTPLTVNGGTVTLSTVMIGMEYEMHYNSSNPTYTMWDMEAVFNVSWEWSLGFLAKAEFEVDMNLNPNHVDNYNLTSMVMEGSITLTDATTTDPVSPGPWEVAPAIPGFPIEAVLMGLFASLVPVLLLRKRRK